MEIPKQCRGLADPFEGAAMISVAKIRLWTFGAHVIVAVGHGTRVSHVDLLTIRPADSVWGGARETTQVSGSVVCMKETVQKTTGMMGIHVNST